MATIFPSLKLFIFKQFFKEVYASKIPLRFFSMKHFIYVPILMGIGKMVSTSINDQQTDKYTNIHLYI